MTRTGWKDYGTESRRSGLIIGLNGVAQSGKDTVGKMLCERHGFERIAFADALRKGLYDLNPIVTISIIAQKQGFWEWFENQPERRESRFMRLQEIVDSIGWDEAKVKYTEVRELMQRYGTEAGRQVHGDECWTSIVKNTIEKNPNTNYVITDMRFPNELQMVRRLGGIKVQIQRQGVTSVNSHVSDAILDEDLFDHVLKNNGTLAQLEQAVNDLVIEVNPYLAFLRTQDPLTAKAS
jgi:hypothetical protein